MISEKERKEKKKLKKLSVPRTGIEPTTSQYSIMNCVTSRVAFY